MLEIEENDTRPWAENTDKRKKRRRRTSKQKNIIKGNQNQSKEETKHEEIRGFDIKGQVSDDVI
jgi:hypothetical protein